MYEKQLGACLNGCSVVSFDAYFVKQDETVKSKTDAKRKHSTLQENGKG